MMKVRSVTVSKKRLSSELDLFSEAPKLSAEQKGEVRAQVGEFLKEQILLSVGDLSSPISGKSWPKLSTKYAKLKASEGHRPIADLEVTGQLLGELDYKDTSNGIDLGVFGSAAPRADGHNNFSGESKIPTRRFLPGRGESFKGSIQKEVDKIINDVVAESVDVSRKDFAEVKTQDELWEKLKGLMPDFNRSEIVDAISRSPELSTLLNEFNLLRWLKPK